MNYELFCRIAEFVVALLWLALLLMFESITSVYHQEKTMPQPFLIIWIRVLKHFFALSFGICVLAALRYKEESKPFLIWNAVFSLFMGSFTTCSIFIATHYHVISDDWQLFFWVLVNICVNLVFGAASIWYFQKHYPEEEEEEEAPSPQENKEPLLKKNIEDII